MIKAWLRESVLTRYLYHKLKNIRDNKKYKASTKVGHSFIDRRKNSNKLCMILAGYKSYLYEDVFKRLIKYMPQDLDVCIVSSGLYSKELEEIANAQSWSYLSTERNCVTLAQNVAILLHSSAEFIYKIDEDIFVTENCFERMMETFLKVEAEEEYDVGFVAPLIPVNGYGHLKILNKLGLNKIYQEKFEKPKYASYSSRMIESNGAAARFFWGEGGFVPSIDQMSSMFGNRPFEYSACPVRFSIGFILIRRCTWEDMGMWKVLADNPCMGLDEEQICSYCIIKSKAIIVAENAVSGHLSFGQQNEDMKQYYLEHREVFRCPEA